MTPNTVKLHIDDKLWHDLWTISVIEDMSVAEVVHEALVEYVSVYDLEMPMVSEV